jgi:hypothetical protein
MVGEVQQGGGEGVFKVVLKPLHVHTGNRRWNPKTPIVRLMRDTESPELDKGRLVPLGYTFRIHPVPLASMPLPCPPTATLRVE